MLSKSFKNELAKTAAPVFLAALGKFLGSNVPAMLTSVRGAGLAAGMGNVAKMRIAGGVAGGVAGGAIGSKTGDEQTRGRNTILGTIAGAVGGATGAKAFAKALPNLGVQTSKDLAGLGSYLQRGKATGKGAVEYMAKNWTPKYSPIANQGKQLDMFKDVTPTAKNFFGRGKTVPAVGIQTHKPGGITGAFGQAAKSISTVKKEGIGAMLASDWKNAKTFNKAIDGKTYQFQRSGLGKIVNPALSTGVGFGAMEALTATDEQGKPVDIGRRLLRGGTTALAWGAAPKLMFGKTLAYDVPKNLIGMKKQQVELPRQ